jgi:hypothetical protein
MNQLARQRTKTSSSTAIDPSPKVQTTVSFDVFLSHNSKDKVTIQRLGKELEARGLSVWLDERELVPGRQWQKQLEEIIQTAKSAAVIHQHTVRRPDRPSRPGRGRDRADDWVEG